MDKSHHVWEVHKLLRKLYPDPVSFLDYNSPYQLMVAVILSAQTTDAQVNRVTPELFRKYPDPGGLMASNLIEVERIIRSTGFYKVKARNITRAAEKLVLDYNSEVPLLMDELLTLPGIGRKSANVIRAHCYNKPAIIVDTHFSRVTGRIGLTESSNPKTIENDLLQITDKMIQTDFSMAINIHGRKFCTARNPLCIECVLSSICRYSINLSE
ncbi:MAG: endonuclease III [Spirochaetales bacterium]|nr:endonuclease III [Spirochaetales bacterium]